MTSAPPLLSIIIPAHNEGAVLGLLLADLKQQETTAFEINVVAHRCSDNTLEVATSAGAHGLTLESGNVCDARNHGAQHAAGSLLIFIDADARIHDKHFLTTLVAAFKNMSGSPIFTGRLMPQENHPLARFICRIKNVCLHWHLLQTMNGYVALSKATWQSAGAFNPARNPFELINFVRAARETGATFRFLPSTTTFFSMRRYSQNGYLRTLLWWLGASLSHLFLNEYPPPIPASEIVRKNDVPAPKKAVRP